LELGKLASELRRIAKRGGGFGSEVEQSLVLLAEALEQRENLDATELKKLLKPKAPRARAAATFEAAPGPPVRDYIAKLDGCSDSAGALSVLTEIVGDSAIKKPTLAEIAGRYIGVKRSFKTKADAVEAIRDKISRKEWDKAALDMIAARAKR